MDSFPDMGYLKQAADNNETAGLLETIRAETPAYWPEGLSVQHFKQGNLWTIHEKQGNAVGFVGWQERREDFEKVGYYSIGVLPEYRRRGIAKEAVSQLLRHKAASVDRVKAFIRAGNEPSEALARDLGVQVKQALWRPLASFLGKKYTPAALGGLGTAGVLDQYGHADSGWNAPRAADFLINALTGSVGGHRLGQSRRILSTHVTRAGLPTAAATRESGRLAASGIGTLSVAPLTTVGLNYLRNQKGMLTESQRANDIAELAASTKGKVVDAASGMSTPALLGAAGVVAAALGAAGYGITKALNRQAEVVPNMKITQQQGGRMRVTLPTKNPNDGETVLDLPYDQDVNISNALKNHLRVDATRRLRAEVNQRRRTKGITAPTSIETASVRA